MLAILVSLSIKTCICSYFLAAVHSHIYATMSYFVIRNRDKSLKKAGSAEAISRIADNPNIVIFFVDKTKKRYCQCLLKLHAQVDNDAVAKGAGFAFCDNFD